MKKLVNWIQSLIPQNLKIFLMRRMNIISKDIYDNRIQVKIASSHEELLAAYQLLYEAYVHAGLMDENEFKIRCNLFTFLPSTVTIVACIGNEVIGTVAAIRDSSFGLPSNKEFFQQNEKIRLKDGVIAEISALAVKKEFRFSDHRVSYLLMKYVYRFCMHYFRCSHLVIVVHPKTENFYRAYLNFERNGPVIRYQFVKGALGIHMIADLQFEAQKKFIKQKYNCFSRFINEPDSLCVFPKYIDGQIVIPVMNQKKFVDFMNLAGLNISNFKQNEVVALMSLYKPQIFDDSKNTILNDLREFRYPVEKNALIHFAQKDVIVCLKNISTTGAFIQTHLDDLVEGAELDLSLQMNSKKMRIKAKVIWVNKQKKSSYLPIGVGIQFSRKFKELIHEVKGWSIGA